MIPEFQTEQVQHYLLPMQSLRIAKFCEFLQQHGWFVSSKDSGYHKATLLSPMVCLLDMTEKNALPADWNELRQKPELIVVGLFEKTQTELIRTALDSGLVHFVFVDGPVEEAILRIEAAKKQINATLNSMIKFNDALGSDLTLIEQKILNCFLCDPAQSSNRKQLFETVWRKNHVHAKTLDVHLFNLRRKLKPLGLKIVFHARLSSWRLEQSPQDNN